MENNRERFFTRKAFAILKNPDVAMSSASGFSLWTIKRISRIDDLSRAASDFRDHEERLLESSILLLAAASVPGIGSGGPAGSV